MIVENSSMKRFKNRNGGVSLRSTGNITRAVVHDRFKKGRGTATKNTGKEIVRTGRTSDDGGSGKDNTKANNSDKGRKSLKERHSGGYRRKDIMRWINEN